LSEAESVLTGGDTGRSRSLDDLVSEFGDQACFALQILARICSQTERYSKASEAYLQALKLNPFLWHAFEELCNRGEKPDPLRTFQVSHLENFSMCHGNNPVVNFVNSCEHSSCCTVTNSSSNASEATVLNTISRYCLLICFCHIMSKLLSPRAPIFMAFRCCSCHSKRIHPILRSYLIFVTQHLMLKG